MIDRPDGRWEMGRRSLPHRSWTEVPSNYNRQRTFKPQPVGVEQNAKPPQQEPISGVTQRCTSISRSWYADHLGIVFARVLKPTTGDLHGISVPNRNRPRRVQGPVTRRLIKRRTPCSSMRSSKPRLSTDNSQPPPQMTQTDHGC